MLTIGTPRPGHFGMYGCSTASTAWESSETPWFLGIVGR
jgi:hypothetical protein